MHWNPHEYSSIHFHSILHGNILEMQEPARADLSFRPQARSYLWKLVEIFESDRAFELETKEFDKFEW